jgi:hypothetical protein
MQNPPFYMLAACSTGPPRPPVGRVKGIPIGGVRLGKWLTREQAELVQVD